MFTTRNIYDAVDRLAGNGHGATPLGALRLQFERFLEPKVWVQALMENPTAAAYLERTIAALESRATKEPSGLQS